MKKPNCFGRTLFLAALLLASVLQRSFADGLNQWTSDTWLVSTVSLTNIWGVAYGDGVYVEAGDRAVGTSTTGTQWTPSAGIITSANQSVVFKSLAVSSSGVFVLVGTYGTLFSSTDGIHWTAQNSPIDNHLYGVTWGNGKFIAVGQGTAIIESADGVNWNPVSPNPRQNDLLCVTYGNNLYVAAATNGPIYTSTSGTSWTKSANTQVTLYALAYGNGIFVGVGDNGAVETSPDGTNWTELVLPGNNNLYGVTFADGLFVANGQNGMLATSPDGVHWAINSGNFGLNNQMYESASFANGKVFLAGDGGTNVMLEWPNDLNGVVSAGGMDVAVGGQGLIVTSTDGVNWTRQSTGTSESLHSITAGIVSGAFGFVAVGDAGTVEWSKNGVTWNGASTGATNDLYSVSYTSNNTFIAVGAGGGVFTSSDGLTWKAQTSGTQVVLRGIGYNSPYLAPGTVVAVGDGGTIITSLDEGATWSAQNSSDTSTQYASLYVPMLGLHISAGADEEALLSPNGTNWNAENIGGYPVHGMAYGDQLLVVAAENGRVETSPDGTNWMGRATPTTSALYGVTLGNNSFLAVGQYGTIIKSGPVLPFETLNSGASTGLSGVALGAGATVSNLVAVGSGGAIIYSTDGVNFNSVPSPTTSPLATVTFADGQYVAVGASGSILTSADGKTWVSENSGASVGLDGITFGQGHYIAVGMGGTILTSSNAVNWTAITSGETANILSITFGNDLFVAVDSDGTILTSTDAVNWVSANPGFLSPLISVTFANGTFLGMNAYGGIYSSPDGVNWAEDFSLPPGTYSELSYLNGQLDAVGAGGTIVSTPLPLGNPPSTTDLYSVVYANGIYAAVGNDGVILISEDGQNWTAPVSYLGTDNRLYGVTYGNGIFLGIGANGWTVRSTDGLNWTSVNSGATSSYLNGVTFGGGQFVAVGDDGAFISSSDGVNWNSGSAPGASDANDTLTSVTFGAGQFVVVGNDNETSFSSPDGNTWTQAGNGLTGDYYSGVAYGKGLFVTVDSDGDIYTSTDGGNWTQRAATLQSYNAVAYGGGLFVAVGSQGSIASSQDGITWAAVATDITGDAGDLLGITYDGNAFVIVGSDGIIFSSVPKALTVPANILLTSTPYEPNSADTNDTLTAVTYGAGDFVVIGNDSGASFTSANGQIWTEGGLSLGDDYYTGLAYDTNGLYVAIDSDGGIYSSTDGNVWTRATSVQTTLNGIAFGNGVFVTVGNSGAVFTSSNGKQWSGQTSKITEDLYTVIFDGVNFVASGSDGSFWVSSNGVKWTSGGVESDEQTFGINALAYNGHVYVGVGAEGAIYTSTNVSPTAVWNAPTNYVNNGDYLNGIAWGAGEFIAVGRNGWLVTSPDGIHWTSSSSSTVASLNAITYADTEFIVVGGDGIILTVGQAPVVTTQPSPAVQYVDAGKSVTLQVTASGSESLTYQWRNGGTNLQNGFSVSGASTATLELSNVALTNSGSYDVVVSDPQGTATSQVAVVNVGIPPSITTQPIGFQGNAAKLPGEDVTFKVAAAGTGPLSYQWQQNGNALSDGGAVLGSASNVLSLLPILTSSAGTYTVAVTSPYGKATSSGAVLQLNDEVTRPTVFITSPAANARTNLPHLAGTATDLVGVEKVNYWITNLNTGPHLTVSGVATLSAGAKGSSNWVVGAIPTYGTNVLAVQSVNYSGLTSPVVTRQFFKELTSLITITVAPSSGGTYKGTASAPGDTPATNHAALNLAEGYSVTAKTNGGWYFVSWTTNGTFATSNPTFNFTMRQGLQLVANFSTSILPLMTGRYDGLFWDNVSPKLTNSGMISDFVVASHGNYSAKLYLQGFSASISGAFNNYGFASNYVTLGGLGFGPGPLAVTLNWTNYPSFPYITGTVTSIEGGWVSQLYMPIKTESPSLGYATNYVMLLSGGSGANGFAAITNHLGLISYGGRLPNGEVFSGATSLGEDGSFPVYVAAQVRLTHNEYLLTNWVFGNLNLSTAASNEVPSGVLSHSEAIELNGLLGGGAAQGPINEFSVLGSTWTPADGANLTNLLPRNSSFSFTNRAGTNFSSFSINSSGTFVLPTHEVQALKSGSISPKNGLMTVEFTNRVSTPLTGYGVFLPAQGFGAGLFIQNLLGERVEGVIYVAPPGGPSR